MEVWLQISFGTTGKMRGEDNVDVEAVTIEPEDSC
jgi:hypothetical protein